jgi:hypothetical protein
MISSASIATGPFSAARLALAAVTSMPSVTYTSGSPIHHTMVAPSWFW